MNDHSAPCKSVLLHYRETIFTELTRVYDCNLEKFDEITVTNTVFSMQIKRVAQLFYTGDSEN